jgi:DNA-binding beta-propeller fold protein YncE
MTRYRVLAAVLVILVPTITAAEPLVSDGEIVLDGVRGRIDHLAIDLPRHRLLVAELGNDTVDVLDLTKRVRATRLTGLAEPQGAGVAPRGDRYAVANARDGTVRLYDAEDWRPTGTVNLGSDADNVSTDRNSGQLFVGYGSGGIATIDPTTAKVGGTIELPAHPEGFQLDPQGTRIFINLPDAHRIVIADRDARRVVATWNAPGLSGNFPMAIDNTGTLVAAVFRSPPTLLVYAAADGTVRSRLPTCGDADDVFFDAQRQRIYVSCGSGAIDVFAASATNYEHMAQVTTASGARTSLFVPELDRLFVAQRAGVLSGDAAIRIFRPQ